MVVVMSAEATSQIVVNSELRLGSSRCIRYVAPLTVEIAAAATNDKKIVPTMKRTDYFLINDAWEGVGEMCQAIDDVMEIEKETELLIGKSVLEIGFATGLLSVLALNSGASEVTVHTWNKLILDSYIKPTMRRNNVPRNMYKFNSSDMQNCLQSLGGKKYDVILAPEFICADECNFPVLHDILDAALAPDGIIFLSGRSFYPNVSGSMPAFMELIKTRGCFDAFIRWTSPKTELAPRKLVQLSRRFC